MESHIKWGLAFIAAGVVFEILLPPLILIDLVLIAVGIALIFFGGREKKIEEVEK